MTTVRLIKHEPVPCGSYEVRYSDGTPSKYFYWDDVPGRRLRPEQIGSKGPWAGTNLRARRARSINTQRSSVRLCAVAPRSR